MNIHKLKLKSGNVEYKFTQEGHLVGQVVTCVNNQNVIATFFTDDFAASSVHTSLPDFVVNALPKPAVESMNIQVSYKLNEPTIEPEKAPVVETEPEPIADAVEAEGIVVEEKAPIAEAEEAMTEEKTPTVEEVVNTPAESKDKKKKKTKIGL